MDLVAIARELAAIAETGGHFTRDRYGSSYLDRI